MRSRKLLSLLLIITLVICSISIPNAKAYAGTLMEQILQDEQEANTLRVEVHRLADLSSEIKNKTPVITSNDVTVIYDGNRHNIDIEVSGLSDDTIDGTPVAKGGVLYEIPYKVEYKDNADSSDKWITYPLNKGLSKQGSYTIRITTTDKDYLVATKEVQLIIEKKPLTYTTNVSEKVYDGTTVAEIVYGELQGGIVGSENVSITHPTAQFSDKHVGENIPVILDTSVELKGKEKENYIITQPSGLTANITAKLIKLDKTKVSVKPKTYDGTTSAELIISQPVLNDTIKGDDISVNLTGVYELSNALEMNSTNVTGVLGGADSNNYVLDESTFQINNTPIGKKELSISDIAAKDKVYDGTTVAEINSGTLNNVVVGDDVTLINPTDSKFETKNVTKLPQKVTLGQFTLEGTKADNYTIIQPTQEVTASITNLAISVKEAKANDKEYDGTNVATVTYNDLVGVIESDQVEVALSGVFESVNAGDNINVNATATLTGEDAKNYSIDNLAGLKATINQRILKVIPEDKIKLYGSKDNVLSVIFEGFVLSETEKNINNFIMPNVNIKDNADTTKVGTYEIVANGGNTGGNYIFEYMSGRLAVNAEDGTSKSTIPKTPFENTHVVVIIDKTNIKEVLTDSNGALDVYLPEGEHELTIIKETLIYDGIVNGGDSTIDLSEFTLSQDISKGAIEYVDGKTIQSIVNTETAHNGKFRIMQDSEVSVTDNNIVVSNGEIWLTLDNVSIDTSKKNCPAFHIKSGAIVHLTLIGNNKLVSADGFAGLQVDKGGTLIIDGDGTLTAIGGKGAAGIGGAEGQPSGNIEIISGNIIAIGGEGANDIGNGAGCDEIAGTIIIHDGANVKADDIFPLPINQDGTQLKHIVADLSKYKDAELKISTTKNDGFVRIKNSSGIFDLWIDKDATILWVKIDEVLYYFEIDGTKLSELKKFKIPTTSGSSVTSGGSGSSAGTSLGFKLDGLVSKTTKPTLLKNWVTNTGKITAEKGFLLATNDGKDAGNWSETLKLDKKIYEVYSFYTKNIATNKVTAFSIEKVIVSYTNPVTSYKTSLKGLELNYKKKDNYTSYTKNNVAFTLNADFGLSGKKGIQYQLVKKGAKFNKNKGWKTLKSNSLTLTKEFNGVAYFKFIDNTGNFTVDKTYGFVIDKKTPKIRTFNSSNAKITRSTSSNTTHNVVSNKAVTFNVNADFGPSGRKAIQYKLVPAGKVPAKIKWSTIKGTKIRVTKNFKGVMYFKFTDKANNYKTYKTVGFIVDK